MKIKKGITLPFLLLGSVVLAILVFALYPSFFFSRKKFGDTVLFPDANIRISVELAATPYQWSKGLMFRESLLEGTGMLFVFPNEEKRSFWMKNTLIPLDIFFISKDKKVVTIHKNAVPCTTLLCPQYASTANAMYVLEVNAGFAEKNNIQEGNSIEITGM